jgi:alpha-1,6-mannosyltransferase
VLHLVDVNNFYTRTEGGGVRTYHQQKLRYFQSRSDMRYTLIEPDDRLFDEPLSDNVSIKHVPGTPIVGTYRLLLDVAVMRRVLHGLQPDLIEIGSPYILPWVVTAAAVGTRAKLMGFWHADYPRAYVERPLARYHPLLGHGGCEVTWWYARQTFRRFWATLAAADCVVDRLWKRGIPRVFQTPLGVDIERYHPSHLDATLRQSVGADDRPLVFFPHRLLEEKGLSALIAAWPRIYQKTNAVLVFAGVGPAKHKLDVFLAQNPPGVHYIGYINDPAEMARWYATVDAVFALSAFETFGLATVEAMASECAVIAANAGAACELVSRAECGKLVGYNDVDAIAEKTIELLTDGSLEQAKKNARLYAERNHSWPAAFDRMVSVYREVAAAPSRKSLPKEPRRWHPVKG